MDTKADTERLNQLYDEFLEAKNNRDGDAVIRIMEEATEIAVRNPEAIREHTKFLLDRASKSSRSTPERMKSLQASVDRAIEAAKEAHDAHRNDSNPFGMYFH